MNGLGRKATVLLLLCLSLCACACNTHNPSYFPYLLPFGSITQTHAKPVGAGYFANFDPHAIRLEVRPMKDANGQDITNQARTQHVLIATVYDEKGQPRRERRVEWMIEGAGHILEVDESGYLSGRGYKTGDKHGVSYTSRNENRITRGDTNKQNDFMIRPGQTWCVLSSAVEGDTHVTVYAPGIADWEKNKVHTTIRWVDAIWEFPQPAQKPAGSEHAFVTRLARATTKQPLAGYRVRYRIKDGPAAYFLPDKTQEVTAISDLSGNAEGRITLVRLGDQQPPAGVNNVEIEVIRPPDPTAPSGSGVVIARGMSSVEWLAPNVVLGYTGPPAALVDEEVTYTASLQNLGKVPSDGITLTAPTPRGMEFVRSSPPPMGNVMGEMLFTLGSLPPGGQPANVQLTFRAKELGQTSSVITMKTGGQTDRKEVVTNIADSKISVAVDGPQRVSVGQTVPINIRVTNTGGGVLNGVQLKAELKGGIIEPSSGATTLNQPLKGPLAPGQTYTDVLNVVAKTKGRAEVQIIAVTGSVNGSASHAFDITEPMVNLQFDGPPSKYIGTNATYTIRVSNPSDAALNNVIVRNQLPPELDFVTADLGQLTGREVVWNLGSIGPGQSRDLKLVARGREKTPRAEQRVIVTSDNAGPANASLNTEIFASAGLQLKVKDLEDPVPTGSKAAYKIVVTNTGTDDAKNVNIAGLIDGALVRVVDGSRRIKDANVDSPINIKDNGKSFDFQSLTLRPKEEVEFTVYVLAIDSNGLKARGVQQMDGVLRCELTADILRGPVIEDENTRIYIPIPGGNNPPPAGGPPAGPFGGTSNNGLTPAPIAPFGPTSNNGLTPNAAIPPVPAPPTVPMF